jgi:6-pyruvoyl tetrahydropterin synthase/QueD family protein
MYRVEIDGREAHIEFQSAHMIPESERCRHLHGHSYFIDAVISGDKGKDLLVDFTELKTEMRGIAKEMDHRMLIPSLDKRFRVEGKKIMAEIYGKDYIFPIEDCFLLDVKACTAELIARHVYKELIKMEALEGMNVAIGIVEGLGNEAWYEP